MKNCFIILLIIGNVVFSQSGIENNIRKSNLFTNKKSNFFFEDDKVYVDTLLIIYSQNWVFKSNKSGWFKKIIGFLAINDLNKEDKRD
jgi:hypothetical protein